MTCRTRTTRAVALSVAAVSLTALAACGGGPAGPAADCVPKHRFETLAPGTLTVAVYVTPPYTTRRGDGLGGVDGSIVERIAEAECLTVDVRPTAGAALVASVQAKRADIGIGGLYRTAERERTLALSDTAYRDGMAVLSRSGVADLAGLRGRTVGVIQGYLWNEELQKALGADAVRIYQSSDGMVNDLSNGRLDAAVLTSAEASFRVRQSAGAGLQAREFAADPAVSSSQRPGQVVLGMPQGNAGLAAAVDADVRALVADGSVAAILTAEGMSADLAGPGL